MPPQAVPRHVAIIMDGNGRWARARGLPRTAGHRKGLEAARDTALACSAAGVRYLTLFAFSVDNWSRPKAEVNELFELLTESMRSRLRELHDNDVKVTFCGDLSSFPRALRAALDHFETATRDNQGLMLQIALNYSGRWDIVEAVRRLADTGHDLSALTEEQLAGGLSTAGMPDPDFFIRTSGELRVSNFMLWQTAYSELYFCKTLWPDFAAGDLDAALAAYAQRERRFGGVPDGGGEAQAA